MSQVLGSLDIPRHPSLLVGIETLDDAGVVSLDAGHALVQSIDIFPPVVDDPYWFGRIAAANSLSDIYAMGARPIMAVNFAGYPIEKLGEEPLREILRGSFDALADAECAMAGGHTIRDPEVKFGLAVVGTVHPERIVRNSTVRPGDRLVLTKPLGSGCLTTALKMGDAEEKDIEAAHQLMAHLNRGASEAMIRAGAHACTDVTGFGLLGHASEMADSSGVDLTLRGDAIPVLAEARRYLQDRYVCGGSQRNAAFAEGRVRIAPSVGAELRILLSDVQTSGGLLVAVPAESCEGFLRDLHEGGDAQAAEIGEARAGAGRIEVE